jgi:hypothetical protein
LPSHFACGVSETTRMVSLLYRSGFAPPGGTLVTCRVTCQAGQGIAKVKFGSQFTSIGEGIGTSADQACPFSVAFAHDPLEVGYLIVYSLGSSLENAAITCSSPTQPSAPRPPLSTNPLLTPAPVPLPVDECFLSSSFRTFQSFWNGSIKYVAEAAGKLGVSW